jgi:hypothetical protein
MESVQRPGEQPHGVVHKRHLSLQQRITELRMCPRLRAPVHAVKTHRMRETLLH